MAIQSDEKKASVFQVAKAVLWSFVGIRRRAEHEADAVRITPVQMVVAGLIGAALFVVLLLTVVRIVIKSAGV